MLAENQYGDTLKNDLVLIKGTDLSRHSCPTTYYSTFVWLATEFDEC